MVKLSTCNKQNLCMDCTDTECMHAGRKEADCPKYTCDNDPLHDCDHCNYIAQYARIMRDRYRKES